MSAPRRQRRKGDGWKHRPHHRAFRALSRAAQQLAIDGFRAQETNAAIIDALLAQHGATIAESSLNRFRQWWEATELPALKAEEYAEGLVKSFADRPTPELRHAITQLLQAQRLTAMTEDARPDPVKLGLLDIEERRVALEERKIAVRERELQLKVDKVARDVEQTLRDSQTSGRALDDETIEKIRTEVYGLSPRKPVAGAKA